MSFLTRPRRVPMLGGRVHLSRGFADLVNLSRSGALIRTNYPLRVGSDWPLTLKLLGRSVTVTGCVVRCQPMDVSLPGGASLRHQFGVAVTFTETPPEAESALVDICGDAIDAGEA